jgi:hypothetical protein
MGQLCAASERALDQNNGASRELLPPIGNQALFDVDVTFKNDETVRYIEMQEPKDSTEISRIRKYTSSVNGRLQPMCENCRLLEGDEMDAGETNSREWLSRRVRVFD